MSKASNTASEQLALRLEQIEARVDWCEAWAARAHIKKPQITPEWLNLLDDVRWLLEQFEEEHDV
jgi:hypothetical protein